MKFCNIEVENRFFLAPMAGVTDVPFRSVCESYGAALTYTEMVSAKALTYKDEKSARMLHLPEQRKPCFAQIFGSEPEVMAEGARLAWEISGAEGIDINMGCPVSKIVGNGEGSALMRDPKLAEAIIKGVVAAVPVPVTVKFRKGFEAGSDTCVEFAKMAEQAGAAAICVHGRTRAQMYTGTSDRAAITRVREAITSIPVIASGDALSAAACHEILSETGVDYVMIARGAEGNPFIFEDCLRYSRGEALRRPTCGEILDILVHHAEEMVAWKGERSLVEFRKHALWYLGRLSGVKHYKVQMSGVSDLEHLKAICTAIRREDPAVKEA